MPRSRGTERHARSPPRPGFLPRCGSASRTRYRALNVLTRKISSTRAGDRGDRPLVPHPGAVHELPEPAEHLDGAPHRAGAPLFRPQIGVDRDGEPGKPSAQLLGDRTVRAVVHRHAHPLLEERPADGETEARGGAGSRRSTSSGTRTTYANLPSHHRPETAKARFRGRLPADGRSAGTRFFLTRRRARALPPFVSGTRHYAPLDSNGRWSS